MLGYLVLLGKPTLSTAPERPTQSALKLKGPNPLESYLKSD